MSGGSEMCIRDRVSYSTSRIAVPLVQVRIEDKEGRKKSQIFIPERTVLSIITLAFSSGYRKDSLRKSTNVLGRRFW